MKNLLFTLFCFFLLLGTDLQAQPQNIGTADYYEVGTTDQSLGRLNFQYFSNVTTFTVGVRYTKGATEDIASTLVVYHALSSAALDAGEGVLVSSDTLRYQNTGESEYQQETITIPGGVGYLDFWYNAAATSTDTFRVAPLIFTKPK